MSHPTTLSRTEAGTNENHRKPSNFLIYPKFQLKLLGANLGIFFIAFCANAFQTWRSFEHIRQLGLKTGLPPEHAYFNFLEFQLSNLLGYLAVGFGVSMTASLAISLYLSHRIAGPITRMRAFLKSVENTGSASEPLQFRKGDFFEDLPSAVNGALSAVKKED